MGILLMNIISFALPMSAYVNPLAYGHGGPADLAAWAIAFVLVEGKMRGLFSLLFGASLLLVIDRADAKGQNGTQRHLRRMAWLFVIGMLHYWFIWDGDILGLYALCGTAALLFRHLPPRHLARLGGALIFANLLIWACILLVAQGLRADPASHTAYVELADVLGDPRGASITQDLREFAQGYPAIVKGRLANHLNGPFDLLMGYGFETLGLMLLGMALFKSGALTGHWPRRALRHLAITSYAIGLSGSLLLVWWMSSQHFDTLATAAAYYVFDLPFRMAVMLGHLAILLLIAFRGQPALLLQRVAAAGRMALSNYILSSLVMTSVFYGYGGALYGSLDRAQAYFPVLPLWAFMMIWSPWWLKRFHYGPIEWIWRSLTQGKLQALKRN